MRFDYDPKLVEQATFLAARRDPEKECALHEAIDGIYKVADMELRRRTFRRTYGELFRRFGLERTVSALVSEFTLVSEKLARCVVREAERAQAQCVDLYRDKNMGGEGLGDQVLIMAVCPDALLDSTRLAPWLYRQLQHVEDMLDERFAYDPNLPPAPVMQQNIIRDRYAALWEILIEGKLRRAGKVAAHPMERLWTVFAGAFPGNGSSASRRVFDTLLTVSDYTHPQLLAWATEPASLTRTGNTRRIAVGQ